MREFEGAMYLDNTEAGKQYFKVSMLYYFRSVGLLKAYKFPGSRKTYWKKDELEAVITRPPEVKKPGPKSIAALS